MPAITITDELALLRDVNLTAPADGESLTYDTATGKWVNAMVVGGGGGGPESDPIFGASEAALFVAGDKALLDSALQDASVFATAAQGALADTALQAVPDPLYLQGGAISIGDNTGTAAWINNNGIARLSKLVAPDGFTAWIDLSGANLVFPNLPVVFSGVVSFNVGSGTGGGGTKGYNTDTGIFYGDGSELTALNASSLASGTVPTAQLGSGTADNTTFLRGDNTWATVSGGSGDMLAANNLSDLADVPTARTNLGLGTAALANTGDFDAAGAAATAQAASQPLDSDLTAIAALATDSFGRDLLIKTSAANIRSYIGAGTGSGDALVANPLSQFAATTSAQLRSVLSDELGTGAALFDGATPTSLILTNATGTAAGLTAGTVTTNANLTGHVTSTGNAAVLGSFTKAQLSTAVSDDDPAYLGSANVFTAANTISTAGAASTPALKFSGVPFAGTGTTSFPLVYINDASATASTTLNTAGTYFGVNGDGTQDLMNLLKDGTSQCKVSSVGTVTAFSYAMYAGNGSFYCSGSGATGNISASDGGAVMWGSAVVARSKMFSGVDGIITLTNYAVNDFTRLNFGGTTSSFPALSRSTTTLQCKLADNSAFALFESLSLKTGAPNTGTSGTWKLGVAVTGQVGLVVDTTRYVELDIGGTLYKVCITT